MDIIARTLWLPKAGNSADEYEDAWAVDEETAEASDRFRCAVADGATEASFSGLWARLLTRGYCDGAFPDVPDVGDFAPLQHAWARKVAAIPLPWYAEEKARSGAFSSLLGLTVAAASGPDGGRWEAVAIGDSCLFQVRDGRLLTAWPLAAAEDFTNRPALLSSNPARNADLADQIAPVAGDWLPRDTFYLLTDALACWFLLAHEAGAHPWCDLDAVAAADGADPFITWIATLRAARTIRNDDVTLLRVAVGGGLLTDDGGQ